MAKKINDLPTKTIRDFWKHMIVRHFEESRHGLAEPNGVRWHYVDGLPLVISLTTGIDFVRIFIRGLKNANPAAVMNLLTPWTDKLQSALGVPLASGEKDKFFSSKLNINMMDMATWDDAADWLWKRSADYEAALVDANGRE